MSFFRIVKLLSLWPFEVLREHKGGISEKHRMARLLYVLKSLMVTFKKYSFVACTLVLFFPPPVALSVARSRFFVEVRRAEDNMTPQSHLRSPVIFDRSLNRYFGAKRDNGACRSTVRLSSFFLFFFVKTQICVMHVKSFAIEGNFQH